MVKKKYSSKNSNRNGKSTLRRRNRSNRRNRSKRAGMKSFGNLAASVKSFSSKLQEGRNLKRQIKSAKKKESGHLKGLNLNALNTLRSLNTNLNSNNNFRSVTALNVDSTCKSKYLVPEQCVGNTVEKRKQHYRKQTAIFHPDKNNGCIDDATEKFKLLEKCCKSKDSGKVLGEC